MASSPSKRASQGSSPLTRGKPSRTFLSVSMVGLIPAHAGKTLPLVVSLLHSRAHPRSRGENLPAWTSEKSPSGSSPLTRGKRRGSRTGPRSGRLIPAHAGKTSTGQDIVLASRAHPRSRGENGAPPGPTGPRQGSSPLTRGKQVLSTARAPPTGLIPAHAGKTATPESLATASAAHPRSRGENPRK